jgi:hypothetical protein
VPPISYIIANVKYGLYEAPSPRVVCLTEASVSVQYIKGQMTNSHSVLTTCSSD